MREDVSILGWMHLLALQGRRPLLPGHMSHKPAPPGHHDHGQVEMPSLTAGQNFHFLKPFNHPPLNFMLFSNILLSQQFSSAEGIHPSEPLLSKARSLLPITYTPVGTGASRREMSPPERYVSSQPRWSMFWRCSSASEKKLSPQVPAWQSQSQRLLGLGEGLRAFSHGQTPPSTCSSSRAALKGFA